ncbi:MAG: cytochrome c biogenesis protein CcsA [Candidatus Omnitrophota bacterium]|nr:cytochrome c biogenesis protein CcsA [Candidatus Omnitrophota bacterium]
MQPYNYLSGFQGLYLNLHIITITLSYFVFFIASLCAVLYLIQDNLLKHKQIGVIFNRLPDLFSLDKFHYRAIGLGFPILTLSILSGFIWVKHIRGAYWNINPRMVYSLSLWLVYALILHVRLSAKLRGRKVAQLSLFAFCIIIAALFSSCR